MGLCSQRAARSRRRGAHLRARQRGVTRGVSRDVSVFRAASAAAAPKDRFDGYSEPLTRQGWDDGMHGTLGRTKEDGLSDDGSAGPRPEPALYVVLEGERPLAGGLRASLAGIKVVHIGRG